MIKPESNQERPDATAIRSMWNELRVELIEQDAPAVTTLLSAFQWTHVNGGAQFAMFSICSHPVLQWFVSRGRHNEIDFPEEFLRSSSVKSALPDLCKDVVPGSFDFEVTSGFTFSGKIARALFLGGAYRKHEAGPGNAVEIAEGFRSWLFADRFNEVLILRTYKPWSAWFCDIAWDCTWLIVDCEQGKVSVLAITDTD